MTVIYTEEERAICRRCVGSLLCLTKWYDRGFVRCSQCGLPYYTVGMTDFRERHLPRNCPRASDVRDVYTLLCDACLAKAKTDRRKEKGLT